MVRACTEHVIEGLRKVVDHVADHDGSHTSALGSKWMRKWSVAQQKDKMDEALGPDGEQSVSSGSRERSVGMEGVWCGREERTALWTTQGG